MGYSPYPWVQDFVNWNVYPSASFFAIRAFFRCVSESTSLGETSKNHTLWRSLSLFGWFGPTSFQLIISGQGKLHLGWKYHQLEDFKRCGIPSLQLNTSGSAGVLWKSHRIWQDTTRSIDSYIASWIVHRYISDVWWKLLIDTLSPRFQKWTEFFHLWRHPFLTRCYPGYPKKTCKTKNSFVSAADFSSKFLCYLHFLRIRSPDLSPLSSLNWGHVLYSSECKSLPQRFEWTRTCHQKNESKSMRTWHSKQSIFQE